MDAHVGHLQNSAYRLVQAYLHPAAYAKEKAVLARWFGIHRALQPGRRPQVLELACGPGNLAGAFEPETYLGVDASPTRVEAAKADNPGRRFETVDVVSPKFDERLSAADFIFCHGLLHHLSDEDSRGLIARVESRIRRPGTFLAMEPVKPDRWFHNPFGWFISKVDEGYFVRTLSTYAGLFGGRDLLRDRYDLYPRFPLEMAVFIVHFR